MSEDTEHVNSFEKQDIQMATSFKEVVLSSQNQYKKLKQPALGIRNRTIHAEISQAIDLSEKLNGNLMSFALDNMPPYIPVKLKESLRKTHPEPIIGFSVLADNRTIIENEEFVHVPQVPDNMSEEEIEVWEDGMRVLDELVVDTLAQEILKTSTNKRIQKVSDIVMRPLAVLCSKFTNNSLYKSGIKYAEKAFGSGQKYEEFRQKLVVSSLSGNLDDLNKFLNEYGYKDLDDYALAIGKEAYYGGKIYKPIDSTIQKLSQTDASQSKIGQLMGRLWHSFSTKATTLENFRGVINIHLTYDLIRINAAINFISFGNTLNKLVASPDIAAVGLSIITTSAIYLTQPFLDKPQEILHELCHYLTQDLTHSGLFSLEGYERKNQKKN